MINMLCCMCGDFKYVDNLNPLKIMLSFHMNDQQKCGFFFIVKEDEHKKLIKHLEEEKTNLTRKLKLTQKMLDEQLEKINAHVSHLVQFMSEGSR